MKYIDIQNDVISKFRVDICDGTKCKNDWQRTHAHVKQRRVCKWKQSNSLRSTFTLLHEVGHIETTKAWMRRAESEFYATVWAIDQLMEYNLLDIMVVQGNNILTQYQEYIDREIDRGLRRGGSGYGSLRLDKHINEIYGDHIVEIG